MAHTEISDQSRSSYLVFLLFVQLSAQNILHFVQKSHPYAVNLRHICKNRLNAYAYGFWENLLGFPFSYDFFRFIRNINELINNINESIFFLNDMKPMFY